MASRKEQKEQARAARIAQQQAAAAKAQRTRRIQIFGGAIAIAVIVIVVAIVVSSSGGASNPGGLKHGKQATRLYNSVNRALAGIPQSGTTLGYPSAKVTLTYYGDLQCPICMEFTTGLNGGGLPEFIQKDVRKHIAKVTYQSLCTATCNDYQNGQSIFQMQQAAAYAAGKQNLFWYYAELFYNQQGQEGSGYVTPSFLSSIAEQIPKLKLSKWQSSRSAKALTSAVASQELYAYKEYRFSSTPSFVISGPKGTASLGSGLLPYSYLVKAVNAVS